MVKPTHIRTTRQTGNYVLQRPSEPLTPVHEALVPKILGSIFIFLRFYILLSDVRIRKEPELHTPFRLWTVGAIQSYILLSDPCRRTCTRVTYSFQIYADSTRQSYILLSDLIFLCQTRVTYSFQMECRPSDQSYILLSD